MAQAGAPLAPLLGGGRQGCQFGCGLLQVGRRGGDDGGFRALQLLRLEPGVRGSTPGGRVEPHEEEPGDGCGHSHDCQAQDGLAAGGDDGADGGADHEDQFGGDGVEGEGRPALFPGGQHAQRLPHHAEDRQGQQAPDEDQGQQDLVGHVRHDRPDHGLGDDRRNQRLPQPHGVDPAPAPGRADGDTDRHHGGGRSGGGVALAEGQDDVQGQQDAGRRVRYAGDHADQQEAPDGPDGQQLTVKREIHGLYPSGTAHGSTGRSPRWAVSYGAARCSLTSIESTRSAKISFRAQALLRPATMDCTPAASRPSSR